MRKLVLGLLGAAALTVGTGANATIITDPVDGTILESFGSDFFGANRNAAEGTGMFTDVFNFTLSTAWDANAQIGSIILNGKDVDFSSIMLDGFAFYQIGFDPNAETWQLDPVYLAAGLHTITVKGSILGPGGGAYSGTVNVAPPVPEPATWAMMLVGFGAVGFAMRRRRRPALLQVA
jgi:hypothetical protein